jgi:lipopolysaccharide export system protein LptA
MTAPALAQQQSASQSKLPIEVTAQESLEWHRDAKLYIARTDAIAKQGTTELHGDVLTAKYVDGDPKTGKKNGMTITRIDAVGNVTVISDGSKATGGIGYYDVASGYSQLTGGNLMLKTPTDTVTARDKLTYDATKSEMNAYGAARAVRGEDVITADRLIGRFRKDPVTGQSKMNELEAIGNVVITTPSDVLHGDRGIYYAATNKATITGNVRIDRGPNVITGARGEVDLNTNISRIFGGAPTPGTASDETAPENDTRVRGVFYPDQ